jgi:phycocyanobilin:ferredoxin oxidoreductase
MKLQMSTIFNQLVELSDSVHNKIQQGSIAVDEGHSFDWPNYVYTSDKFRRAHLDIVDARDTKKLYMMHLCIFPHYKDPSPIFGLDLIAGPNKITGAFHDFSMNDSHEMSKWFQNRVKDFEWSKPRQLPDWAKNIFSPSMVAAGNIQDEKELDTFIALVDETMNYYLGNVGTTYVPISYHSHIKEQQNYYCQNQKQNPHTPRVMESLGLDVDTVKMFIQDCLFPENN